MGILQSHFIVTKFSKLTEVCYMLDAVLGKRLKYVWPIPRISEGSLGMIMGD